MGISVCVLSMSNKFTITKYDEQFAKSFLRNLIKVLYGSFVSTLKDFS